MRFSVETETPKRTTHNHDETLPTSHLLSAVSYTQMLCSQYSMLLPVTTMSTVMNNNKNKATMKETSKNCVSDYPLSNTGVPNAA
jgi:hypothetical protein